MTREEVHDLMENELRCVQRGNYCDRDCAKCPLVKEDKELIEAYGYVIKALEQEPRWIPVSEKLPKAGEYVGNVAKYYLVQNEYGDMLVARYTHSGYWEQIYQLKPYADEIVAWMPLPLPYKADQEDT